MKKVLIFTTAYNIAVCSARGGRTLKMANKSYSHLQVRATR